LPARRLRASRLAEASGVGSGPLSGSCRRRTGPPRIWCEAM